MTAIETAARTESLRVRLLRGLGTKLPAAAVGGLAFGIGLRIAMRVAAVMEGQRPELTLGGTMFIVVFGAMVGSVFGPLVLAGADRLGRGRPAVASGVLSTLVLLPLLVLVTGDEIFELGSGAVNAVTFGASTFALGAIGKIVEMRIRARDSVWPFRLGTGMAAGGAAGAVVGLIGAPMVAWLVDRVDGGAPHATAPSIRVPRVESITDVAAIAIGSLFQGLLLGALLGGVFVAIKNRRPLRGRTRFETAAILAVVAAALVGTPGALDSGGGGLAIGIGAGALVAVFAFLLTQWQPRLELAD